MISLDAFLEQGNEIRSIIRQLADGQMVHALMISGEKGLGKRTLATLIAAGLLCRNDNRRPCGKCNICRAVMELEHPDLTVIRKGEPIAPDVAKGRATIPVDDIREMIRISGERTLEGGVRVFMIFDADKMTPQAQNSLLKTLEEPPENTHIILVTDHAENLLTTVHSRCRTIRLHPWTKDYVFQVLQEHGIEESRARNAASDAMGSIGKALELASNDDYWDMRKKVIQQFFNTGNRSDIIRYSNEWKDRKADADQLYDILEMMIRHLLQFRLLGDAGRDMNEFPEDWKNWARKADLSRFTYLTEAVHTARMENMANVNFQASVEQLLLVYMGERTK